MNGLTNYITQWSWIDIITTRALRIWDKPP